CRRQPTGAAWPAGETTRVSCALQHLLDGRGDGFPVLPFAGELLLSRLRDLVKACLPIVLRDVPVAGRPSAFLEPPERWKQRSGRDLEDVLGEITQTLHDAPSV